MVAKNIIVLLTGEIATGKSTLAKELVNRYDFNRVETRALLQDKAIRDHGEEKIRQRGFLQSFGNQLDKKTNGQWVVHESQGVLNNSLLTVIDAIRIKPQIDAFRARFHPNSIVHIHLTAPDEVKLKRFMERKNKDQEITEAKKRAKYDEYKADETERQVETLKADADLVIQTEKQNRDDILTHVASFLKLRAPILKRNVDIVVGGQFGSEGKGQIAAYLSPEYDCLIRVGGPNAGHKVFETPIPHTFHLIPSGSNRNRDAKIVIVPGAVISESKIIEEIHHFNVEDRIIIDPNATIITEDDMKRENIDGIGSTKQGVGAATAQNLFEHRLKGETGHKAKNSVYLKPYLGDAHEIYDRVLSNSGKILLEGTQGTMLDLHHGFYPHVTSRPTTTSGCLAEAGIGPGRVDKTIVVFRRYPIRVESPQNGTGTSGPFSLEDVDLIPDITWEEVARRSGIPVKELRTNEKTSSTKRKRRVAEFNWALLRKSCELNTATDIAFSFADYIDVKNRKARQYDQLTLDTKSFIEEMEQCAGVPVSLVATNFDFRAIVDRRKW